MCVSFDNVAFASGRSDGRLGFYHGDLLPDAADMPLYNGSPLPRLASKRDAQQFV